MEHTVLAAISFFLAPRDASTPTVAANEFGPRCGLFFPFPYLLAQYVEDLGV